MKNSFWNFPTSKDWPFQCSKCSKTFNSTTQLEHHIARVHELRNCETCPHCGKIYSRLKAHLLTCNVRGLDRVAHECPGCDRKFLDEQNFKKTFGKMWRRRKFFKKQRWKHWTICLCLYFYMFCFEHLSIYMFQPNLPRDTCFPLFAHFRRTYTCF